MKWLAVAGALAGAGVAAYLVLLLVAPLKALNVWAAPSSEVAYGPLERQRMDVYEPTAAPLDGRDTTLVFFHGGNWDTGSKADYRFVATALADEGVRVVVPNYRLGTFPAFMEDAALAVAKTRERSPDARLFVMGHSAGAHIAALLALDPRHLAAVDARPEALLDGWIGLSGPYDFLPITSERTARVFPPETRADSQPLAFAGNPSPPALLVHGTADATVHDEDTRSLDAALRAAGTPVRAVLLEGKGHRDTIAPFGRGLAWIADVRAPVLDFLRDPEARTTR